MKHVGTRYVDGLLRRAGLERSGPVRALRHALARCEERTVELKRRLEQTRGESEEWRTKYRVREEQRRARAEKVEREYKAHVARLEARAAAQIEKVKELRDRLEHAERSARIGREHLMSIEVKLDLIEGAVNVLDRRYRTTPPDAARSRAV